MLPDRSVLIGQKLVENAKIQKFKCDILGDFQTLCAGGFITSPSSSFAAGKHCLLLTRSRKEVPSISMASFSWVLGYYPLAFPVLQHPLLSSRNAWRHQAP